MLKLTLVDYKQVLVVMKTVAINSVKLRQGDLLKSVPKVVNNLEKAQLGSDVR